MTTMMMDLNDTAKMMASDDYKERFKAEFYQTKIRLDKLLLLVDRWDKGELDFTPTCPREIYSFQIQAMKDYLDILYIRANLEKIKLGEEE